MAERFETYVEAGKSQNYLQKIIVIKPRMYLLTSYNTIWVTSIIVLSEYDRHYLLGSSTCHMFLGKRIQTTILLAVFGLVPFTVFLSK